ncbi:MAG: hypothetical protein ACRCY9_17070, partial [Phycicoccus sp.]
SRKVIVTVHGPAGVDGAVGRGLRRAAGGDDDRRSSVDSSAAGNYTCSLPRLADARQLRM